MEIYKHTYIGVIFSVTVRNVLCF